jgi:hypothetical protein
VTEARAAGFLAAVGGCVRSGPLFEHLLGMLTLDLQRRTALVPARVVFSPTAWFPAIEPS